MSATLLDAPSTLFAATPRARAAGGRRPTLEELLDGTWRTARSHAEAECPVCHAAMHLDDDLARCGGCGTTLS
ncbi:MAG: hypothetical protein QOD71_1060 [Thermoleophilaceae bacterium]|jgi:hypothetical protein|nr:hypothetical protein [Thermoleophilaceae bacterium]